MYLELFTSVPANIFEGCNSYHSTLINKHLDLILIFNQNSASPAFLYTLSEPSSWAEKLNKNQEDYYRGMCLESLLGSVWATFGKLSDYPLKEGKSL